MPDVYVNVPIDTDASKLATLAYDYIQETYPNWLPNEAQLGTRMIGAISQQAAVVNTTASDVPSAIFRYFGATLLQLPPLSAVAATTTGRVNVIDNAGYNFADGELVVGIRDASGNLQGFRNVGAVVVVGGTTFTAGVPFRAIVEGADSSGLGAPATNFVIQSATAAVVNIVIEATTEGGSDEEEDDAYLDRMVADLRLQAPRPILQDDVATYVKNTPGIFRALALDEYDSVAATFGHEKTVTVAVTGAAGLAVSGPIKAAGLAALQAARELNFVFYVVDANYTTIDVQWDVLAYPGNDLAAVEAEVAAAIAGVINPATFGNLPLRPPGGNVWTPTPDLKVNDLIVAAGNIDSVNDVNFVKIRKGADPFTQADIVLTGVAPLPLLGTNTGTAH